MSCNEKNKVLGVFLDRMFAWATSVSFHVEDLNLFMPEHTLSREEEYTEFIKGPALAGICNSIDNVFELGIVGDDSIQIGENTYMYFPNNYTGEKKSVKKK